MGKTLTAREAARAYSWGLPVFTFQAPQIMCSWYSGGFESYEDMKKHSAYHHAKTPTPFVIRVYRDGMECRRWYPYLKTSCRMRYGGEYSPFPPWVPYWTEVWRGVKIQHPNLPHTTDMNNIWDSDVMI